MIFGRTLMDSNRLSLKVMGGVSMLNFLCFWTYFSFGVCGCFTDDGETSAYNLCVIFVYVVDCVGWGTKC